MAEKDLPSSSDESDEDFVPENENNELLSEESGSGEEEDAEHDGDQKKTKRNRKRRKVKTEENKEEEPVAKKKEVDIDAIWADFKQDVTQKKPDSDKVELKPETEKPPEVKKPVRNLPSFSSNKPAAKGGLASVLNKLGKKDKLSTLEKSKLDWNKFKQNEGIDEEIKIHNRGKDGYLEKQDFLQRADQRQFEIEKQLRTTTRSFR